jgi:hypothetical protein
MIFDCAWRITSALQYNNDDNYCRLFIYSFLPKTHLTLYFHHAVQVRHGFSFSIYLMYTDQVQCRHRCNSQPIYTASLRSSNFPLAICHYLYIFELFNCVDTVHHRVGRVLSVSPVVGIGTPPPL